MKKALCEHLEMKAAEWEVSTRLSENQAIQHTLLCQSALIKEAKPLSFHHHSLSSRIPLYLTVTNVVNDSFFPNTPRKKMLAQVGEK